MGDWLSLAAEQPIEEMEADGLFDLWQTADDIASRLRARLVELKYWHQ